MSPQLTYYPDSRPGITRMRCGRGFSYRAPDGTRIDATAERRRIEALAVPPAYEDVWICPLDKGHLQATGRDSRNRKQYRYHPDWRSQRDAEKYDQLAAFGMCLPALRRRIRDTLRRSEAGEHDFAIAAILALLDRAALRVGHADYTRENKTFGATTLRRRHLRLDGDRLRLTFRAKGNKLVRKDLTDATLNRTLTRLGDLPGPHLVAWLDGDTPRAVTSDEVNSWLSDCAGEGVTAKTFRTWNGSVAALEAAMATAKPTIKALSEAAAARLHNTPTIARNAYIHPKVIALTDTPIDLDSAPSVRGLRSAEAQLLHLIGD